MVVEVAVGDADVVVVGEAGQRNAIDPILISIPMGDNPSKLIESMFFKFAAANAERGIVTVVCFPAGIAIPSPIVLT